MAWIPGSGASHPAQILLNRTMFNVNPNKPGFDAFNVGTNLMSSRALTQMFDVHQGTGSATLKNLSDVVGGRNIKMFDVETSGIFRNSQIVQMATSDISSSGSIKAGSNVTFRSQQLGGLMYGEGKSFSDLFKSGKVVGAEDGGKQFLDEATKMINGLMEKNSVIAGHNVNFDIEKLTSTMKQMDSYSSHKEAQQAVGNLFTGIESGETLLVDTLEYNRAYMNDLVNTAVEAKKIDALNSGKVLSESDIANYHREFMYAPEIMADTKIGGGAAYASVEAISLNTDLTARIVRDSQAGDQTAIDLLEQLRGGSHVADTDTLLQSFIYKYTTTSDKADRLQLKSGSAVYSAFKTESDVLRRQIYKSSALVPTKNIADVQHISQAGFNYTLTDEGIKNVSLYDNTLGAEGFIRYDPIKNDFMHYADKDGVITNYGKDEVRATLQAARRNDKTASSMINNLGINYGQNSRILEMGKIASAVQQAPQGDLTSETILQSLGKVYKNFSSDLSFYDQMKISTTGTSPSSPFKVGFGANNISEYMNKSIEVAQAATNIGSPYNFLDTRSTIFSTILAEATQENASIGRAQIALQLQDETLDGVSKAALETKLKTFDYASQADIFTETGVSHFRSQQSFAFPIQFQGQDPSIAGRIILPAETLQNIVSEDILKQGRVSLSIANREGQDVVNAFWSLGKDATAENYMPHAEKFVADALAAHESVGITKVLQDGVEEGLRGVGAELRSIMGAGVEQKALVDLIAEGMAQGGIGFANIGGQSARRVVEGAAKAGLDLANDVMVSETSSILDISGGVVRLGAMSDQTSLAAAGNAARMDTANSGVIGFMNKAANVLEESGSVDKARRVVTRSKLGREPSKALSFFIENKKGIYGGAAALVAAGTGYYMYKNYKEDQIYDETLSEQPTSGGYSNGRMMQQTMQPTMGYSSYKRDSLATAGVVGGLDRNKIGHHKMGSNKNSHLFGG